MRIHLLNTNRKFFLALIAAANLTLALMKQLFLSQELLH